MPSRTTFLILARLNVLLLSALAIGLSLLTVFSCQFFSYRTIDGTLWDGFESPFDELSTASVGLFKYSQLSTPNDQAIFNDACLTYPDWQNAGQRAVFQVAQWCSIFAPVAAFLAWIQVFFEMICCRFCKSFLVISTMFLLAAALQAGTFVLFADTEFCLEPESVNECTFKKGSYYSLGATVAYILLACLAPNLPSFPGEKDGGCCIFTRSEKNGTNGNGDGEQPILVNRPVDPELPGTVTAVDPELPETVTASESDEVATRSVNESRFTAIHADGSLESKSVTVRADGSVHVEVRSPDGTGSESVQRWVYPNEAAARFAGHITDTFDEGEEQVEVDVDPIEEWDNAEELVSAL